MVGGRGRPCARRALAARRGRPAGRIPLNRFQPAPAGDRFFGVPSPHAGPHLLPQLLLLCEYAHDPLVLVEETPDGDETVGSIVEHQTFLHLNGGGGFVERVALNLDVPIALVQKGKSPSGGGVSYASPDSPQFGDLRAGVRVRILGERDEPIQLGLGGYVWFPTGPSDALPDRVHAVPLRSGHQ